MRRVFAVGAVLAFSFLAGSAAFAEVLSCALDYAELDEKGMWGDIRAAQIERREAELEFSVWTYGPISPDTQTGEIAYGFELQVSDSQERISVEAVKSGSVDGGWHIYVGQAGRTDENVQPELLDTRFELEQEVYKLAFSVAAHAIGEIQDSAWHAYTRIADTAGDRDRVPDSGETVTWPGASQAGDSVARTGILSDKLVYRIGDTVRISLFVTSPANVTITDADRDGSVSVLFQGPADPGLHDLAELLSPGGGRITAYPPLGVDTLTVVAETPSGSRSIANTWLAVVEAPDDDAKIETSEEVIRVAVPRQENDLQAIAQSLGNDAGRIYEFVRNRFAYEPVYGYLKGPWLTVHQESGSDCDLAALLVELLRVAGYDAKFAIGAAKIPASQLDQWVPMAGNWIGVSADVDSILRAFRRGRIASAQFEENGIPYVSIDHVWVRAKIDNLWYDLDPSFKQYDVVQGVGLAEAVGFQSDEFLATALEGASVTADYARDVNADGIAEELSKLAERVSSFLEQEVPGKPLSDALGYRAIIAEPFDVSAIALPYSTIVRNVCDALPSDMVYRLQIETPDSTYEVAVPDLSGARVTAFPTEEGGTTVAVNGTAITDIDPPADEDESVLRIAVMVPNGEEVEQERTLEQGIPYGIVVSAGTPTDSLLSERTERLRRAQETHTSTSEPVLGELIHILGMKFFSEKSRICSEVASHLSGVNYVPLYGVAIVTGGSSYGIDVKIDSRIFVSGPTADRDTERALDILEGIIASACEHAHIEQLLGVEAVSTIAALCQANSDGLRLFRLTRDNKDEVLPLLTYPESRLNQWEEALDTEDTSWILLPERPVAVENWVGAAYVESGRGYDSYIIGKLRGGIALGAIDSGILREASHYLISVPANGAHGPDIQVSETTGRFRLEQEDLCVSGSPPASVGSFTRTYDSGTLAHQGGLGFGWSYPWQASLRQTTDWRRGLGGVAAYEAAPLIASVLASLSVLDWRQAGVPIPVERWLIAAIAAEWALDQLTDNAVVLKLPQGGSATFVEQFGSYSCPTMRLNLEKASETEFVLEDYSGNRLEFSLGGRLECWSDASGNELRVRHDATGRLASIEDARGRRYTFEWSGDVICAVVSPAGARVEYAYDASGNLTDVVGPDGQATAYTYDDWHHLTSGAAADGSIEYHTAYDWRGRVQAYSDGDGYETRYLYGHQRTVVSDPLGSEEVYCSDSDGLRREAADSYGKTWLRTYDPRGNLVWQENPLGESRSYAYDTEGLLTRITDPLGASWRLTYDEIGQLVASEDPLGSVAQYSYDECLRMTSMTDPTGLSWSFTYDDVGNPVGIQDPLGQSIRLTYDEYGYLASVAMPSGHSMSFAHSVTGLLETTIGHEGESWSFTYDPNGNLSLAEDPLGYMSSYEYDARQRLKAFTDAAERTTQYAWDNRSNLNAVTLPDSSEVTYVYDDAGRLVEMIDQKGLIATLGRDDGGRISQWIDPLGRATQYSYDAAGRLLVETLPSGSEVSRSYDSTGRLVEVVGSGENARRFEYDAAGNLVSAACGEWLAEYSYDLAGRLIRVRYPSWETDVTHTYDGAGRPATLACSTGGEMLLTAELSYDGDGRLTGLVSSQDQYSFGYNASGDLSQIAYANGVAAALSYDTLDRLREISYTSAAGAQFLRLAYQYDPVGNVVSIARSLSEQCTTSSFSYDVLDRLTLESHPEGSIAYTYDPSGNRLRMDRFGESTTYDYDAADQLVRAGECEYRFDEAGNVASLSTEAGLYRYQYDDLGCLRGILVPSGSAYYFTYDAFGRIATVSSGDGSQRFIYDGSKVLAVIGPEEGSGSVYVYGPAMWLLASTEVQSSETTYYHLDRLGSLMQTTNRVGEVVDRYYYDAFGNAIDTPDSAEQRMTYLSSLGVMRNPACEHLFIAGSRHYDSAAGRFLSQDPIQPWFRVPTELNPYAYCKNNPLRYVDPQGLSAEGGGNCAEDSNSLNYYDLQLLESKQRVLNRDDDVVPMVDPTNGSEGRSGSPAYPTKLKSNDQAVAVFSMLRFLGGLLVTDPVLAIALEASGQITEAYLQGGLGEEIPYVPVIQQQGGSVGFFEQWSGEVW